MSKIPFIGDVPVLGKFFQSISKTRSNTELIVIVTPEIVAPIPAGRPLPALNHPDKFLPSNSHMAMTTPGADVTGAKPLDPAKPSMPVEKLIQSLQPEQPLVIETLTVGSSYGSAAGAAVSTPPVAGNPLP